ncbi:lipase/acyltransferase domain-containing protein [Dyadobacter sp. CY326]|uniref:alpha/beta hydrolase n=1 Tax=Dyadobacter sp. CY326 TaxID=2907300 RepID=UPI001F1FE0BC|nr:hypothetical protein [Dyadobacter sp. CY326]MCE7067167.1 hypothetical protein [Dyadobacter sp. CY326]
MLKNENPMANTLILVHGFMDTGRRMTWMSRQLSTLGWKVLTPSLLPSNGTQTIEKLAERLSQFIQENTMESDRIDLIAFSMGGLISRYYLQRLGGLAKTDRFITIATPHHGTLAAYFLPLPGIKQMRPNSPFLSDINASHDQLKQLVFVSYYSPFDLIIIPAKSSVLPTGRASKVLALIHPLMIFDSKLLKRIVYVLENPVNVQMSE